MASKANYMNQTSLTVFLLMITVSCHRTAAKTRYEAIKISAIIDSSTRIGKESKVAMEIAATNFNNASTHDKIFLQFHDIQASGSSSFFNRESIITLHFHGVLCTPKILLHTSQCNF